MSRCKFCKGLARRRTINGKRRVMCPLGCEVTNQDMIAKPKPERGPRGRTRTCGCSAGILINRETLAIERCDECALFASDGDAMIALDGMLKILGDVYEAGTRTAPDAHYWIADLVKCELKELKRVGLRPRVD